MFRGISTLSMDEKGRMALPKRYRAPIHEKASGELIVTIDTEDQCLLLYPLPVWEKIELKIEALPSFNKAARRIQRLLLGHATELTLDAHGRVLIPQPLQAFAGLSKKVMLVGQGKKFELWDEDIWLARRTEWLAMGDIASDELPEELMNLSL